MTKPVASIKVLTYNHHKYVARCLDSLLEQKTDYPFEIVIGDDNSTDGTKEIIQDYRSRYPRLIRIVISGVNKGFLHNDVKTMWKLRGKYQLICDGDDYWTDPLKLQKQVDYMEAHPGRWMVHADTVFVDENGREMEPSPYFVQRRLKALNTNDLFWDLWEGNFILNNTLCIRHEMYKSVIPRNEQEIKKYWFKHDHWFWLQLAWRGRLGYIDEKMAAYRSHPDNITVKGGYLLKRLPVAYIDVARSLPKEKVDTTEKRHKIAKKMIWILLRKDLPVKIKMDAFGVLLRYFPSVSFILNNLTRITR